MHTFRYLLTLGLIFTCIHLCANDASVIGLLDVPKGEAFTPGERWKDEEIESKKAVRLTAGTAYAQLNLTGELPKDGNVLLKINYFGTSQRLEAGIGIWGSPTLVMNPTKGWHTESLIFPAVRAARFLKDGKISLIFKNGGPEGPAIGKVELLVPTKEQTMELFREWVLAGTKDAWEASKTAKFQEIKVEETVGAVAPTPEEQKFGLMPIIRNYLGNIYPNSAPDANEHTNKGSVMLAQGEYEPWQFGIKALKDFDQLHVDVVGDAPKGLKVDVRWMECMPVRNGGSRSSKFKIQPQRMWPQDIFPTRTAKNGESVAWWVILKSADDAPAGNQVIKLAVKNGAETLTEFQLDARVLPFKLPPAERLFLAADSTMVDDDETMHDMAEHGMNGLGLFDEFQPYKNGAVDFTYWDASFERLKKHGLNKTFFWYLGNPKSGNNVQASVGEAKFLEMIKGIQQRVEDGRYPKTFMLSIDEAVKGKKAFEESKALYQQLKTSAPNLKLLGCALDEYRDTVKYDGNIDMLACNGSFAENAKWCLEKKIPLNMYSSISAGISANQNRLSYGFHAFQRNATAVNGWALRWYNGHPFNDLDAGCTDWGIFLPNWTGAPISTPAWEGYREGVDDQRYLTLYEKLVNEGKADGALLQEIKQNGIGKMKEFKETVVGDSEFGAAMKNPKELEIARARVIKAILAALGK